MQDYVVSRTSLAHRQCTAWQQQLLTAWPGRLLLRDDDGGATVDHAACSTLANYSHRRCLCINWSCDRTTGKPRLGTVCRSRKDSGKNEGTEKDDARATLVDPALHTHFINERVFF